jgi:hypothetical protein
MADTCPQSSINHIGPNQQQPAGSNSAEKLSNDPTAARPVISPDPFSIRSPAFALN